MASIQNFNGKWALVTGASSGIGAALARELAKHGAKLILTARRLDRLQKLAGELTAKGTEVRIVTADLNDPAAPQKIFEATEGAGITVDVLINNAGLGQYGAFGTSPAEQELGQIRVNCEAMVRLTRLFVPRMIERRRGWVLVLASTASFQPVPYITTYAATKAFDRFFALGLAAEVARFGVNVTALCPGPTESEFFDVAHAGAFKGRGQPQTWRGLRLQPWRAASAHSSPTLAASSTLSLFASCRLGWLPILSRRPRVLPEKFAGIAQFSFS
jgi:short-subunit dehydrogenase